MRLSIRYLRRRFGVYESTLDWFADFVKDRIQIVSAEGSESTISRLNFGVPQGSVYGPKLLAAYIEDIASQLLKRGLVHHHFMDDTKVMLHCLPVDVPRTMSIFNDCFVDASR